MNMLTDDDYAPSTSLHMPLYRRGVVMELKDVRRDIMQGRPLPSLENPSSSGCRKSRDGGAASCPDGDCECASCIASMVINNELIFFRKFSDPSSRKKNEPRLHYYKLKVLQDPAQVGRVG